MKLPKRSSNRRRQPKTFGSSLGALASLAGLPSARRVHRTAGGQPAIEVVTIDMNAFAAGISDLLRAAAKN